MEHDVEWTEGQLVTIASAFQKSKRERFSVLKPTVLQIKFWCPKAAGLGDSSGNLSMSSLRCYSRCDDVFALKDVLILESS